ncbi:MAG: ankyrin repeat domain-containing protein (plasmid) [Candidatus Cardinium sp.]|nr:MAG: ankyrin repeat domain-containing protein [Candidatus Cardinium sp.]
MVLSLVSCDKFVGRYGVNENATYIPETLNGISRNPIPLTNYLKTQLHISVENSDINGLKSLLNDPKTDVNATDSTGKTSLYYASELNKLEIVSFLVTCEDIDVNKKNSYGNAPIHVASRLGHFDIVEKLMKCTGIDINAKNSNGDTALNVAFDNSRTDIVNLLLQDIRTEREASCSICLDDIFPDTISIKAISLIHITTCGHFFHKSCVKDWVDIEKSDNKICPICRQAIKPVN